MVTNKTWPKDATATTASTSHKQKETPKGAAQPQRHDSTLWFGYIKDGINGLRQTEPNVFRHYGLDGLLHQHYKVFARAPERLRIGDAQDVLFVDVALQGVAACGMSGEHLGGT